MGLQTTRVTMQLYTKTVLKMMHCQWLNSLISCPSFNCKGRGSESIDADASVPPTKQLKLE